MRPGNFRGALKTRITFLPLFRPSIGRMFFARIISRVVGSSSLRDIRCTRRAIANSLNLDIVAIFVVCIHERALIICKPIFIDRDDYRDRAIFAITIPSLIMFAGTYTRTTTDHVGCIHRITQALHSFSEYIT